MILRPRYMRNEHVIIERSTRRVQNSAKGDHVHYADVGSYPISGFSLVAFKIKWKNPVSDHLKI